MDSLYYPFKYEYIWIFWWRYVMGYGEYVFH